MPATLSTADAIQQMEDFARRKTNEEKAAKAMSLAKTQLVLSRDAKGAFFATLALRMQFAVEWSIDTAATDGRRIVYNPDFVLTLTAEETVGLLAHEVMHVVNKHFARRCDRPTAAWNVACDLAINHLLIDAGFQLPDCGVFPGQEPYQNMPPGLAAEEYFALLPESAESGGSDPGRCGGVMEPTNDQRQPADDATIRQIESEVNVAIAAAHQAAKRRGDLPGALERMIGDLLAPVVDWKQQLRDFMAPANQDFSWKQPARRHIHRGLFLPACRNQQLGDIVAAIDTSGSITDETLRRFASELDDIARQGAQSITIVYHDSQVVRVDRWTPDDGPLTLTPCGGGGTDHCPVFEWLESATESPAVVICLTDLWSSFPENPPAVPVLWVSTDSRAAHPFGERINIPAE